MRVKLTQTILIKSFFVSPFMKFVPDIKVDNKTGYVLNFNVTKKPLLQSLLQLTFLRMANKVTKQNLALSNLVSAHTGLGL